MGNPIIEANASSTLSPISQVPRIEPFRSELIITGTNFMDIPCPGDLTKHGSLRGISIVAGF